ncbi:hypothetical protein NQ314_011757 [Rhamnusium bicolor]|uniref:CCHC-type domain-containing protein n=1 Tax=Rhamnusium bicolor TaxID=1586634 RepID=A0AAV8XGP8_9CUCU|nr:hypothetical protein NQ314_011757 [Rhamnusium bicolor]
MSEAQSERRRDRRMGESWTPPPRECFGSVPRSERTVTGTDDRITNLERLVNELQTRNTLLEQRGSMPWHSEKFNCIPRFEPGIPNLSAVQWIHKIDQMAETNGWNQVTTIAHMQSRLTGLAKKWYDNLPKYDYSWGEWKQNILKAFPDNRDFAVALRTMLARKKDDNENWSQYYFDKMELVRACELPEKHAVSCIIDGIPNEIIQTGARAGRYENPESLFSSFLSTLTNRLHVGRQEPVNYRNKIPGRDHLRNKEDRRAHPYQRYKSKCYNCREEGHLANVCTKPKKECTKCKRLGHISANCKKSENVSCKTVGAHDKCYYITCEINGQKFLGYVDTGCGGVIVRKDVIDTLKLKYSQTDKIIEGYNNSVTQILGTVTVLLTVDCAEANVNVLIVENSVQTVPVLIGQEFIKKNKILIVRNNEMRVIEDEETAPPGLGVIPVKKIVLVAEEDVEVLPGHVGYIPVTNKQNLEGDVFIEGQVRSLPMKEHLIVRCVTKACQGCVSISEGKSENVQEIRDKISTKIREEQTKSKVRFDAKRKDAPKYKEGQQVLVLKNVGSNDGRSRKLLPKYDGPFIVKKVLQHDRYYIEDLPGAQRAPRPYKGVYAVDRMKPYNADALDDESDDSDH